MSVQVRRGVPVLALLALLAAGPAAAQSTLYLVRENFGNDLLLKYEAGILSTVGPIGFQDVRGIAYDATTDTLYGVSRASLRLIAINRTTGAGTAVADADFLPSGSNTSELSVDAGCRLVGLGHPDDQTTIDTLLDVDRIGGVATPLGNFGALTLPGLAADHAGGTLYGTRSNGNLYTIAPDGSSASFLGTISGSNGAVARIAFDQATGTLYGITSNAQLVTVNLGTLVATQVAQFSLPPGDQIYAVDFLSGAPCPALLIDDVSVAEGGAGTADAVFTVTLLNDGGQATVDYATGDETAGAPGDYAAASGTLTLGAGQVSRTVTVAVSGDASVEQHEMFRLGLSGATGALLLDREGQGTILNDDAPTAAVSRLQLTHGQRLHADLAAIDGPFADADWYRLPQQTQASYEVVVDATSGGLDTASLVLERVASDGTTVVQTSAPVGTGASRSLRWASSGAGVEFVRVGSAACGINCGPDDVYRIRAYETTYSIPRFNNAGTQVTVLLLQNPTDSAVAGTIHFWSPAGSLLSSQAFSLAAKAALVLNTTGVSGAAGASGTITVAHDGRYGELAGKTVALEPSTGFSFDTPMVARAR